MPDCPEAGAVFDGVHVTRFRQSGRSRIAPQQASFADGTFVTFEIRTIVWRVERRGTAKETDDE